MDQICQSCGMDMVKKEDFGTNADGMVNQEYCCYCFQNGKFSQDCTMEEMVENNLAYLDEYNRECGTAFGKEEARKQMMDYFPTLKRWKN